MLTNFTNMAQRRKNIALLAGGYSGESVISIKSAAVIEKNLDPAKYKVFKIVITRKLWYYQSLDGIRTPIDKNDFSITINHRKVRFDCAFIAIHGTPGEDGLLQGYFEMLGIPYTTCDSITSALTFNKGFCNKVVAAGLYAHVAKSVHLFGNNSDTAYIRDNLKFPCFVKPNAGGSSIGMSKVNNPEGLDIALAKAFHEDHQVLVEEFISGREITCGMIKVNGKHIVFPLTEIISQKEFFDYEAKYQGKSMEITPADLTSEMAEEIRQTATRLYDALNCKGIVRFDFIVEQSTKHIYFLEVNTVPGQSENSIVPQQARAMGLTIMELYTMLIEETLR